MNRVRIGIAVAISLAPAGAQAGKAPSILPTQVGDETAWYHPGGATVQLVRPEGVVEVEPLPLDHGSLAFRIAVLNTGAAPANIGPGDVTGMAGKQTLASFTASQLTSKAKNRAMWSQIGIAAIGGLAAAGAASQRDYYHSTFVTPSGTYRYSFSTPSVAGQIQAAAITAGTGYSIARIQDQLDRTRAAIGDTTLQLATIEPGDSYAARVVLTKVKGQAGATPQRIDLQVRWAGATYPFAFVVGKSDMVPPPMKPTPTPPPAPVQVIFDPPAPMPIGSPVVGVADELGKLAALRDRGILTQAEFETQKHVLLAGPH